MGKFTIPKDEPMAPGHMGCLGCGGCLAMRLMLKAAGRKTIISVPACCWAVMPGVWPNTCIEVPMLYTAFEVTGAPISGIRAALDAKGITDVNVIGWAGDGGTMDIGIQALSGMVERDDNCLYICYDNEAYMNTGIQRSSSTPIGAWTTTTPVGSEGDWEKSPKKPMVEIMAAHKIAYTASASVSYPEDFIKKVRKALSYDRATYIQVFAPCPTGWKSKPEEAILLGKLAVSTRAFPLYEVENGVYKITHKPKKTPLKDYMRKQGRFGHVPDDLIEDLDAQLDHDWDILLKKEKMTNPEVEE